MGITSLKQHDVVNRLREACEKGSVNARQGAFGAFECLSEHLGRQAAIMRTYFYNSLHKIR